FSKLRPFFWNEICDNYIEAIKHRFYSKDQKTKEKALKNSLNLFYKILKIFAVIIPYISEEIYSIIYYKYKKLKSIHLEKWSTSYDNLSKDSAIKGKIGIEIIKTLRMLKSRLQMPLNQDISKIIIFIDRKELNFIEELKEDIKNTLRISELLIFTRDKEKNIQESPDLKEIIKEYGIILYFYR
ncbi:MAG: class I tRNA ligase family protein, partial [Promethearchaeota archaeon]